MNCLFRETVLAVTLVGATLVAGAGTASAAPEAGGPSPRAQLMEPSGHLKLTNPSAPDFTRPGALARAPGSATAGAESAQVAQHKKPSAKRPHKASRFVPEFDGKSTGAAAALVLGGVLVMVERRRRRRSA